MGYKIYRNGTIIGKRGKSIGTQLKDVTTGEDNGYIATHVDLGILGKTTLAHRAVAMAFIPNPDNLPEINHKNGIKNDNRVENLEWVTESENQVHASYVLERRIGDHHYDHHLTDEQALEIYELCKEGKMKRVDIGAMYGVTGSVVHDIVRKGKNWKHLDLEPLPPLHRGSGGKGSKAPRSFYKITDVLNNTETIFTAASCAARYIGSSAPPIIKYARGERRNQLFQDRYKIEELPFPKGKGIPKKQETISIDEYEKLCSKA